MNAEDLKAAHEWAAQLPGQELCLTRQMIGQTQKPINLAWMMTIGDRLCI